MIDKGAVAEFLNRDLKDYTWIKQLSRAELVLELKERLREEGLPWPFTTTPRLHQLACFVIGWARTRFMWGLDMGGGKTKLVLDLFRLHKRRGKVKRLLVCVPKKVHMGTWITSIEEHAPDLTVRVIPVQSLGAKWEALATSTEDVVVIDYKGIELAVSDRNAATGKYVRKEKKVKQLAAMFDAFAFDEVHHVSRHDSLLFAVLRMLTKDAGMVYGMTGTLTGRDPSTIWAPMFLVDRGESCGETLGMYRAALFVEKKNYFGGFDYKFNPAMMPELRRMVSHSCIQYTASEFNDLPPLNQLPPITFRLPDDQRERYKQAVAGTFVEVDGKRIRIPTDGVMHRMRELCSGFRRVKLNGVEVVEWFDDNPKLDLLTEFVEDVPPDRKGVIFFDYTPSGAKLMLELKKRKIGCVLLDGTVKDTVLIEKRFREDDRIRFLVANNASGAEGINAQVANYVAYFEIPTDPRKWLQGLKRTHRDGQVRRVTVKYFLGKGTIEEKLFGYLHEGRDLLALLRAGNERAERTLLDVSSI